MEKVHQILDFVRLKHIAKRRHTSPSVADLMLDLRFLPTLADRSQIRSKIRFEIASSSIRPMAMLAPFLVKQRRSSLFAPFGARMNRLCGPPQQA